MLKKKELKKIEKDLNETGRIFDKKTVREMITRLKVRTPKGTPVLSKDGKTKGKTTGAAYQCALAGCPGFRIAVRWPDGKVTRPCSKGMSLSGRGWRIL